ncbi:MAG: sugar ABC transporter permease [Spirochaetaceae bacterium]|nr:MAG: sugar ABC transporter permease [Spirochaetaceae bacterium]
MMHRKSLYHLTPYLFVAFPLLIYTVWVIGPMLYTFYLSLTDWDGISDMNFVRMENYSRLFRDRVFYTAFLNNIKWIASFITFPVVCGLALAMALNRSIPGAKAFKAIFFFPMVLSFVVMGLIWSWMYNPDSGIINSFLRLIGMGVLTQGWLSDSKLVIWSIIFTGIWRQVGYVMLLYLAGLQSVNTDLVDASRVDGANAWQSFRQVIIPQLAPITVVVVVISIIDSLRAFDLVYVMTRGGPYNSSQVLATFMYNEAFWNYRMGYGASISVVLFMISLLFIFVYLIRVFQTETRT